MIKHVLRSSSSSLELELELGPDPELELELELELEPEMATRLIFLTFLTIGLFVLVIFIRGRLVLGSLVALIFFIGHGTFLDPFGLLRLFGVDGVRSWEG